MLQDTVSMCLLPTMGYCRTSDGEIGGVVGWERQVEEHKAPIRHLEWPTRPTHTAGPIVVHVQLKSGELRDYSPSQIEMI